MLGPAVATVVQFYYPLGNTPAISWVQDLPQGEKGNILSLGCGDVRNILFTSNCVQDGSNLDITCCDLESTIIARNILFLSLILDGDSTQVKSIWDIYYHMRIDSEALKLLEAQAHKLEELGDSLETWHDGPYGKQFRICDSGSLRHIRHAWNAFATSIDAESGRSRFENHMKRAKDLRKKFVGDGLIITGYRSVAPVITASITELPTLHGRFWEHGTTDPGQGSMASRATTLNPTFVSHSASALTLHYGTDPLLGFHLAAAYAPTTSDHHSYLRLHPSLKTSTRVVREARLQLQDWVISFRRAVGQGLTLRFYVGDGLVLCHVFHALKTNRSMNPRPYRSPNSFEVVSLDSEDYSKTGTAPMTFDVIDTSNLMDHNGPISLLIATSPLLNVKSHAVLYTASLVKREASHKDQADSLLCGHLPTMSTLLGILALEYWTNATVVSTAHEVIVSEMLESGKPTQMFAKLTWGRMAPMPLVRYEEKDLADVLYHVYGNMFEHLDVLRLLSTMSKPSFKTARNLPCPRYHQGSFAMLLHFVHSRCVVQDWDKMMGILLDRISGPSELLNIQQLYAQLDILGLYDFKRKIPRSLRPKSSSSHVAGLETWKYTPDTMCITLIIPRKKLDVLTNIIADEPESPILQCQLRGSGPMLQAPLNLFEVINYTFGSVSTSGQRFTDAFQIRISEDAEGWLGTSPMVVTFRARTWQIEDESRAAIVSLNIQNSAGNSRYLSIFGMKLEIASTNLSDKENVFLTRGLPNQAEAIESVVGGLQPQGVSPR